jgi:hypothetical protein
MTPQQMTSSLLKYIVNENCEIYRDLFNNTNITSASDPYWQKAISFYNELDINQKESLFSIIRQTTVDTVSSVLGIIDGSTYLEGAEGEFTLLSNNREKLNGELQNFFLEQEENS